MKLFLNFFAFQVGWFSCVIAAARGSAWIGCLIALLIIAIHLFKADDRRRELQLLALALITGSVVDSLLVQSGWVSYPSGQWLPGVAPYWILVMWLLFATTLTTSLQWLKGRLLLATLLGATGGPLSYIAGQKLDAIILQAPTRALAALAVAWALALPFLIFAAFRESDRVRLDYVTKDWKEAGHV